MTRVVINKTANLLKPALSIILYQLYELSSNTCICQLSVHTRICQPPCNIQFGIIFPYVNLELIYKENLQLISREQHFIVIKSRVLYLLYVFTFSSRLPASSNLIYDMTHLTSHLHLKEHYYCRNRSTVY